MNRRGFFGVLGAAVVSTKVVQDAAPPSPHDATLPRVELATGNTYIVGVATQDVRCGDMVQICTRGVAPVRTSV